MLLPSLPSGVSVNTKSKPFSYVHNSGSTSDIHFVQSNLPELQRAIVEVSSDIFIRDHLSLKYLPFQLNNRTPKWFLRSYKCDRINCDRINITITAIV